MMNHSSFAVPFYGRQLSKLVVLGAAVTREEKIPFVKWVLPGPKCSCPSRTQTVVFSKEELQQCVQTS